MVGVCPTPILRFSANSPPFPSGYVVWTEEGSISAQPIEGTWPRPGNQHVPSPARDWFRDKWPKLGQSDLLPRLLLEWQGECALCWVFSEDRQLKGSRDTKTETPSHVGAHPCTEPELPWTSHLHKPIQFPSLPRLLRLDFYHLPIIISPEWSNHHILHVKTLKPREVLTAPSHQNPSWAPALGPSSPHKWRFMHFLTSPCPFLFVKTDYDFCVWMKILGGKETVERSFLELS